MRGSIFLAFVGFVSQVLSDLSYLKAVIVLLKPQALKVEDYEWKLDVVNKLARGFLDGTSPKYVNEHSLNINSSF